MQPQNNKSPALTDHTELTDPQDTLPPSASYTLRLGDGLEFAEFEPANWRLTVYHVLGVSRLISLGYAEVFLLEYLVRHPGQMISRQQLLNHAWGDRVVSQGSLNQAVSNLRALLGDDQKREIIITVPRRGYQLNTEALMESSQWLKRKAEILSAGAPADTDPASPGSPEGKAIMPASTAHRRAWHAPALWGGAVILSGLLIASLVTRYAYTWWPPFVSDHQVFGKVQLTVVAKDPNDLAQTREALMPVLARLDEAGGGVVLVNRVHNYLEFNCRRIDGTVHTLLVHRYRLDTLDDDYLSGCLK